MLSINDILNDNYGVEEPENSPDSPQFSVSDLEKTSEFLKELELIEDEIKGLVKTAWEAGRSGIEKEAGMISNALAKGKARKALRTAETHLSVAEAMGEVKKIEEKALRIREGKGGGIHPAILGMAGGAAVAGPIAYNMATEKKKQELSEVAKKYYQAGRNSETG